GRGAGALRRRARARPQALEDRAEGDRPDLPGHPRLPRALGPGKASRRHTRPPRRSPRARAPAVAVREPKKPERALAGCGEAVACDDEKIFQGRELGEDADAL